MVDYDKPLSHMLIISAMSFHKEKQGLIHHNTSQ